ncbi:formyltransferase family protein [Jannaschia sp. LMIT008]|uniref:formyltransferase family protein n=1 Tax=Jannaschia maritima TaxID=3032585 RepID=UPI002811E0DC|nr:formyltransferase family protein [Jannaschia sp. LMIT008]
MTGTAPDWWRRPRRICALVDNDSWILPHAERLVAAVRADGDECVLARRADDVPRGEVAFLLGCVHIVPPDVLARNRLTLVVHESALPRGRGFAPMTWAVLDGADRIPVSLIEAAEAADEGDVFATTEIVLDGTELCDALRAAQGAATVEICLDVLRRPAPPVGRPQTGTPSWHPRRRPADSRLDPHATLAAQFDLLRVVDNERYPAFFEHRGRRYRLAIHDDGPAQKADHAP